MARSIAPHGGAGEGAAWIIPGLAAVAVVIGGALWVGGGLASLVTGHGWVCAPFTLSALITVATSGPAVFWPGPSAALVLGLAAGIGAVVLVPALVIAVSLIAGAPAADDPVRSLARAPHLAAMLPRAAAQRAQRLRPSLADTAPKDVQPGDLGIQLGQLVRGGGLLARRAGAVLYSSWEDVAVAFMAPRSGKTTSLAVPITLAAPGPVVLTSNKTEGWAETATLRRQQTGQAVWTFDPQQIAREPQTWWWNPLRGVSTVAEASRLAGHFVSTVEGERGDIWGPAAKELLATLMLAAAVSDGEYTLIDVYEWLADEATPVPRGVLADHGFALLSRTLRGTQDSPPETRGSVYFTARAATQCLRDAQITAWITPPPEEKGKAGLIEFTAETFPDSRQTLYLLSKDEGGSAGPLVAALTDRVMRAGITAAEQRGGRLDPPMVLVLDEVANICRIADLPALYSHLGSRGIIPWTILQSYAQAEGVWGQTGTKALWGAATIKLIGAGMDDATFAEDISRLVGDHEVSTQSRTAGGHGGATRTWSTRTQRILPAAMIRALPKGTALLLATGTKPAQLSLLPWYRGPQREQIATELARARRQLTDRASTTA